MVGRGEVSSQGMVVAASIAVGLIVGLFSGMLGVGGGTLLVPVFRLGFGMDAIACTATSLFTIIPTSVSGTVSHLRKKTCIPALGIAAGLGGAVTSPVGVWLAGKSPDWAIMIAAACVIGYSSITMLRKALAAPRASGKSAGEKVSVMSCASGHAEGAIAAAQPGFAQPAGEKAAPLPKVGVREVVICALIGLAAGVVSGYVGVGGGFIMVPLMMSVLGVPMRVVSGTSLMAVMILAVPGVAYQGYLGNVEWLAGLAVAFGTVPGAYLGGRLASRVPERALRFTFAGFLFLGALMLALNQLIY